MNHTAVIFPSACNTASDSALSVAEALIVVTFPAIPNEVSREPSILKRASENSCLSQLHKKQTQHTGVSAKGSYIINLHGNLHKGHL